MSQDQEPAIDQERDPNPYTRPGFIASAGVIVLIAALVPILILTGGEEDPDGKKPAKAGHQATTAPAQKPSTPAESPSQDEGKGASCPALTDTKTDNASARDLDSIGLSWKGFGPVNLPASKAAGPAVVDKSIARCYAHTPRGAVLALANISVRSSNGPNWRDVVAEQVYPDEAQKVYEEGVAASRTDETSDYPSPSAPRLAGYKLVSYSPDTATVDLAFRDPGGTVLAMVLTARWHQGDWKQQMSPEGGQSESVTKRFNTDGYTLFPGG